MEWGTEKHTHGKPTSLYYKFNVDLYIGIDGINTTSMVTSVKYKFNIIFVVRNRYKTNTCKLVADDLVPQQNYEFKLQG